ncbi:cytochrome c oxidase subunit II [Oxalobacteraceae bacterium CAVE-383]|nr:cytochrome c oxidase subunit II [Oxalobacteraceae bacterium CAVE-383]
MKQSRRSMLLGSAAGIGMLLCAAAWKEAGAEVPAEGEDKDKQARVIRIEAKKFVYTPNEIRIKKGEKVLLALTALDFVHGFNLPDFKLRTDIPPGKVTTVALNPMEAGRFTFLCDNFCGNGHEEMNGVIIVE